MELLRLPQVTRRTGMSRANIYRMMAAGHFPQSVKLTARSIAWVSSEVDDWIKERIQASRPDAQVA